MTALIIEKHIVVSNDIRSGKPRIADTRITVSDVVIWHFQMGYSLDEIAVKWDLSLAAVYAALSFYYDHKVEIDEQIKATDTHYQDMKDASPSLLQKKIKVLRDR